jgi:hypothetical protein
MSETLQPNSGAEDSASAGNRDMVINARFHANGLVDTITSRPDQLTPQEWFDRLCRAAPQTYQPLAGGRGAFRIPSDLFDSIRDTLTAA